MYIKRIIFAVAILVAVGLGAFSYYVYQTILAPNTAFQNDVAHVYIETNADYQAVIQELTPILKDLSSFHVVAEKKGYAGDIIPGHFILKKGMNNNQIINVLRSRNTPVSIVFNNQERLQNLAGRLSTQIEADSLALLKAMKDSTFLAKHGFTKANALSMYIPNKYEFYWNTSAEEFRSRMWEEYNRFWNENRLEKAEKIGLTPQEVSALAAIVQKETVKLDERRRVAGVYMNRLKDGWPLQADPTVIYSIKKTTQNFDTIIKRVLYKDLKIESPYNTYQHAGLPPGPITMPDISSIEAVLNYEKHDYYFFVANPANFGYHKFAETLSQHNRNKADYVQWLEKHNITR